LLRFRNLAQLDTSHSVGHIWKNDQPVAENSKWQQTTITTDRQTDIPQAGFEPAILASERPQTDALNREATGISGVSFVGYIKKFGVLVPALTVPSIGVLQTQKPAS